MTNYPQRHTEKQGIQNRDVNAVQRASSALQHRIAGKGYQEIATLCSYGSAGAAHKAIMREMQRVVVKDVDELRATELQRLEVMHQELWEAFMDRKNKGRYFAADRIIAVMERRARLMGLDVPVENAIAANMVVVRELPSGYLGLPEPQEQVV